MGATAERLGTQEPFTENGFRRGTGSIPAQLTERLDSWMKGDGAMLDLSLLQLEHDTNEFMRIVTEPQSSSQTEAQEKVETPFSAFEEEPELPPIHLALYPLDDLKLIAGDTTDEKPLTDRNLRSIADLFLARDPIFTRFAESKGLDTDDFDDVDKMTIGLKDRSARTPDDDLVEYLVIYARCAVSVREKLDAEPLFRGYLDPKLAKDPDIVGNYDAIQKAYEEYAPLFDRAKSQYKYAIYYLDNCRRDGEQEKARLETLSVKEYFKRIDELYTEFVSYQEQVKQNDDAAMDRSRSFAKAVPFLNDYINSRDGEAHRERIKQKNGGKDLNGFQWEAYVIDEAQNPHFVNFWLAENQKHNATFTRAQAYARINEFLIEHGYLAPGDTEPDPQPENKSEPELQPATELAPQAHAEESVQPANSTPKPVRAATCPERSTVDQSTQEYDPFAHEDAAEDPLTELHQIQNEGNKESLPYSSLTREQKLDYTMLYIANRISLFCTRLLGSQARGDGGPLVDFESYIFFGLVDKDPDLTSLREDLAFIRTVEEYLHPQTENEAHQRLRNYEPFAKQIARDPVCISFLEKHRLHRHVLERYGIGHLGER